MGRREARLREEFAAKVARGGPVPQMETDTFYGFKWVQADVLGPRWYRAYVRVVRWLHG